MTCAPHGNVVRHSKDTSTCTFLHLGTSGFQGGVGVVMTCAPHGNVARHSKDTSTCTLVYLETSGFRGGVSGFGVGFRGRVSGFRGGVSGWGHDDMRPAWKRGTPQQGHFHMHTPLFGDFSFFALQNIYSEMLQNSTTMPVSMECEINTQNKPGMPWRKWVAIHNLVASAFLHYKISTQKCFRTLQLCQCPWNVKSTLKPNLDRLGEN